MASAIRKSTAVPKKWNPWKQRDPIKRLHQHLLGKGWLDEAQAVQIEAEARDVITDAVRFAETSPLATAEQAWGYLYSGPMMEVYRRCES